MGLLIRGDRVNVLILMTMFSIGTCPCSDGLPNRHVYEFSAEDLLRERSVAAVDPILRKLLFEWLRMGGRNISGDGTQQFTLFSAILLGANIIEIPLNMWITTISKTQFIFYYIVLLNTK